MPIPTNLLEQKEHEVQQALRNLRALRALTRSEVGDQDVCPICLLSLESIFEEHEAAEEVHRGCSDSSSEPGKHMTGVVKLSICGHIFCRRDLADWIESHHGSCPTCRQTFFIFTLIDEAEYESSDGGEYIPEEDEDYDEFTDGEFDVVASSDIDYEMDDVASDVVMGPEYVDYFSHAEESGDMNTETRPWIGPLTSLMYMRGDDFRVYAHDEADEERGAEEVSGDFDDVGGLSYGSDSPSSEAPSFEIEGNSGACATVIGVVPDEGNRREADKISVNINEPEVKSSPGHRPGPSVPVRDAMQ